MLDMMRLADFIKASMNKGKFTARMFQLFLIQADCREKVNNSKVTDDEISSIVEFKVAEMFPQVEEMSIGHVISKTIMGR